MSHDIGKLNRPTLPRSADADRVPRPTLSRSDGPTALSPAIVTPLLCVLASGRKRVFLGREEYRYDPNAYLIASADLPVRSQVVVAPCLR